MEIITQSPLGCSETVAPKSADRRPVDDPSVIPRKGRSRVTNGSALLPGVDGRSPWIRRCKDLISEFINVHLAGADNCSPAERAIVRRIAVLVTELERLEAKFAVNNEAMPDQLLLYGRTANTLRRLLEAIGLGQRQRDAMTFGGLIRADQDAERQRLAHAQQAIDEVVE
jgi:hypothetical protein